ncbi:MAG: chemotaxis protein CheA [Candidatus Polarisedimenticolaceae bacterium]|nr:chemotaxis protein CheA [Candidatus Polarisedimenticolaceae bacterium]
MALDLNDEILQDFLVEAGEILELLGEQLVDLEQSPDDYDLLNAVFRGFHTIKGGAGFLAIDALVGVCHRAEDVFNVLRQGQRKVDATLMDAVLEVVDIVNDMFASIREGINPPAASQTLLDQLALLAHPESEGEQDEAAVETAPAEPAAETAPATKGDLTDTEFEALLDAVHAPAATPAPADNGEDISEDEFEALLDELHGKGQHGGTVSADTPAEAVAESSAATTANGDDISEDEFESLLDELHGKGQHGSLKSETSTPASPVEPSSAPTPAEEPAAAPEPVETPKAAAPPPPSPAKTASPNVAEAPKAPAASKAKPPAETTVRVDTQRLDDIMNMVGELVLVRNRLSTLKAAVNDEDVANAVGNLDVVTADLQLAVMKTRMQPIKKVFGRFPRVVRDLARSLKKEIDLKMEGEDTDLDKNLVEALADPLVHLVRNAVDHGIEMPDEREAAGKPRQGSVLLTAAQEGDHILLSITDDGKGMDANVLRRKAVEKGMMDEEAASRLDDRDCYNLIFHPGFSTKDEISDVSGRGVGMDVVKTRISQMNGSVEVESVWGEGSRIVIKLPLTLAILPTLMVILGEQPFALPLASVVEIFNLDLRRTNVVDGQLTIMVRERALPLFYLNKWLIENAATHSEREEGKGHVVVVNVGNVQIGLVVDYLIGQEEVVIKPLGALLQGLDGMAGATITGDGKIALILDIPGLMKKYAR